MQQTGVISCSNSAWSSPIVLVRKKDGEPRFCVDYRALNKCTKKRSYPLPRIDDSLDQLSCCRYFSTLDLKSGYWQIPMKEKDKEKTAFTCHWGLFHFNVMPFGLCNAPATFQHLCYICYITFLLHYITFATFATLHYLCYISTTMLQSANCT